MSKGGNHQQQAQGPLIRLDKYLFWGGLLAVACVQALLVLNSPLLGDDYWILHGLTDFQSLLNRIATQYMEWDGRFVAYFVNHLPFFLPDTVAGILLALVLPGIILVMCRIAQCGASGLRSAWHWPLLLFGLLWVFMPAYGEAFFWRAGSFYAVDALYTLCLLLPFLSIFYGGQARSASLFLQVLVFIPYVLLGSMDYTAAGGVIVFICCVWIYCKICKRAFPTFAYFALLGLLVGMAIALAAPGNYKRLQHFEHKSILRTLQQGIVMLWYYYKEFAYVLLGTCLIFFTEQKLRSQLSVKELCLQLVRKPRFICALSFLITALAICAAFTFSPAITGRALTVATCLFVVFILLLLTQMYEETSARWRGVIICISIYFILLCSHSIFQTYGGLQAGRAVDEQRQILYGASAGKDLCVPSFPTGASSWYILPDFDIDGVADNWKTKSTIAYFSLNSLKLCKGEEICFSLQGREPLCGYVDHYGLVFPDTDGTENFSFRMLRVRRGWLAMHRPILAALLGMENSVGSREKLISYFYSKVGLSIYNYREGKKPFLSLSAQLPGSPLYLWDPVGKSYVKGVERRYLPGEQGEPAQAAP